MTTQDDLEQQLWDYIYGLLEPAEARALEARITSEHDVARAYAETRQRADLLGAAARVSSPEMKWQPPAEEAPALRPVRLGGASRTGFERGLLWFLSSAALVLVGLVGYAHWRHTWQRDPVALARIEQELAGEYLRVIVSGPAQVQAEIDNLYTVQLQDLNGVAAAKTEFAFGLASADGKAVVQQTAVTDADGNGVIGIDGTDVTAEMHLKVWTASPGAHAPAELKLARAEPSFATYLHCNKSVYHPGETMYFRSVTLPVVGAKIPREFPLAYHFQSPSQGITSTPASGLTEQGVGNGKVTLGGDFTSGRCVLSAQIAESESIASQLAFDVQGQERLLALQPVPTYSKLARTPPAPLEKASGVEVHFWPEGGTLVAGLDNKVYFGANTADGTPAQIRGVVVDSRQNKVADIATSAGGNGTFHITPDANESYSLAKIESEELNQRTPMPLPDVAADVTAKLSTDVDVFAAGKPLMVDVVTAKAPAQLLVTAARGEATVTQQFVEFAADTACPATQRVSLPLADEVAGTLQLLLYDCDQSPPAPIAQQFVYRQPTQYLKLTLEPSTSGDTWGVRCVDEQQRPRAAVLGVNVVAENSGPAAPPSTLYATWYAPPATANTTTLLGSGGLANAGQTPLAGSFGLPGIAARDQWRFLQPHEGSLNGALFGQQPAAVDDLTALGDIAAPVAGTPAPPMLQDNLPQVEAAYQRAVTQWRDAQQNRLHAFAMLICIGSALLLLATVMMVILRLVDRVVAWLPALGVATAALVIGCIWLGLSWNDPITIAARPVNVYDGAPLQLADARAGERGQREDYLERTPAPPVDPRGEYANQPVLTSPAPTPSPTVSDFGRPVTEETPASGATDEADQKFFRAPAYPVAPDRYFLGGTRGSGGLGGGGSGPVAAFKNGRLGLFDRLAARDFYSFDFLDANDITVTNEAALQSSLGKIALNFADATPLPIVRYSTSTAALQPTGAPRDREAIFWDPFVQTGAEGEAQLRFTLPSTGRFRVSIDAHGSGRIGSLQQVIERTPPAAIPAPAESK